MVFASNLYPPYFTIVFFFQGLNEVFLILSIVFVVMVVATEKRWWKNTSHISWINGLLIITLSLLNLAVFSINVILLGDTCGVLY
jgi:steroid 5-alpha reductase family enzyme